MKQFSGIDYLRIDIANQYGLDKEIWDKRIQWVLDNDYVLEAITHSADKPLLYAKAVRAYRTVQQGKPTNFIMALDSTGSGIQILGILAGCITTCETTNVIDTGNRRDIYTDVVTEMNNILGTTKDSSISRKDIKKATIPVFYGSKNSPKRVFNDGSKEHKAYLQALYKLTPGALKAMDFIQGFWNPEAIEYRWTLPDNHHVQIKVMVPVDKKIELDDFDHCMFTYRTYQNLPMEKGLSLAANIVHSIDGYIVREMIRRCNKQGFEILTIHDSFWASPKYMNQVRKNFIEIMVEISKMNLLKTILEQVSGTKVKWTPENKLTAKIKKTEYIIC